MQRKKGLNKHTPHVCTELLKYVIIPSHVTEERFKNLKQVLSVFHIFYSIYIQFWNDMRIFICVPICIQQIYILVYKLYYDIKQM